MPDCNYCGSSFADEESYLQHLHDDHETDELSRIDRRRVQSTVGSGGGDGFPTGPVILGSLVLVTLAATVYVAFFLGGGGGTVAGSGVQTPTDVGAIHEHGTINVTIAGDELDFSRPRFQHPRQNPAFHFEGGNGQVWHVHARGVTLEYAMATLGIQVNRTAVTYDGTTYRESEPNTTVVVEVNGQPVNPRTYVLQGVTGVPNAQEGDHVRIVVRTDG